MGVKAVGEVPVRRGAVYALLCEKEDSRALEESKMADRRMGKRMPERRRLVAAHRERQKACVRYEGMCEEEVACHLRSRRDAIV